MRRYLKALALGAIVFTHRWWGGIWWTDIWDVEYPNVWTHLSTVSGWYESPW